MTVKLEANCDDVSNNNSSSHSEAESVRSSSPLLGVSNPNISVVTSTGLSLNSVVQRLIDKKMGRRKQNCPQRTGMTSEDGKALRGSTRLQFSRPSYNKSSPYMHLASAFQNHFLLNITLGISSNVFDYADIQIIMRTMIRIYKMIFT